MSAAATTSILCILFPIISGLANKSAIPVMKATMTHRMKPFVVEYQYPNVIESYKIVRLPVVPAPAFTMAVRQALELNDEIDFVIQVFDKSSQTFERLATTDSSTIQVEKSNRLLLTSSGATVQQEDQQQQAVVLALPWKEFQYDFAAGEFQINHKPLRIQQVENAGLGTGLTIWDGSVVLAKYLEEYASSLVENKNVLELGSGTGLVGIGAGFLGAKSVVLTDLRYTHDNIRHNIHINEEHIVTQDMKVEELDWLDLPYDTALDYYTSVDLVVASDVVWLEGLIRPLVSTFSFLFNTSNRPDFQVIMSYQSRSTAADLLLESTLKEFHLELTPLSDYFLRAKKIALFRISKLP